MTARAEAELARKQRLLNAVREAAKGEGVVPGIRRFSNETGEPKHLFEGQLWPSWGAFVKEAGLEPAKLTQAISDDDLMRGLAGLTRKLRKFPAEPN